MEKQDFDVLQILKVSYESLDRFTGRLHVCNKWHKNFLNFILRLATQKYCKTHHTFAQISEKKFSLKI